METARACMAALRGACPSRPDCRRSPPRVTPLPLGRRGSTSLLGLKTSTGSLPYGPYGQPIRAKNGGAFHWPSDLDPDDDKPVTKEQLDKFRAILKERCQLDKDMPFREEIETISEYWNKITSWNTSIFHIHATSLSLDLCMVARQGVRLASIITDGGILKLDDKQNEISLHTTKQTLAMYVSIFVNLAEETYHKRFNVESGFSLIGALRGLAAISHILLQDAMASPNFDEASLSNHSFTNEIDSARNEFQQKMDTLEERFRAVPNSTKSYELLSDIMFDANRLTAFFVYDMVAKRAMVLGMDSGAKQRHGTRASDDDE